MSLTQISPQETIDDIASRLDTERVEELTAIELGLRLEAGCNVIFDDAFTVDFLRQNDQPARREKIGGMLVVLYRTVPDELNPDQFFAWRAEIDNDHRCFGNESLITILGRQAAQLDQENGRKRVITMKELPDPSLRGPYSKLVTSQNKNYWDIDYNTLE